MYTVDLGYQTVTPKQASELSFWAQVSAEQGDLRKTHGHYAHFYTTHFGLAPEFYTGKRILDIGCGPAGSLEWADNAKERVGLDSLADAYLAQLHTSAHKMRYVSALSEAIPYPDGYFDVVCSFNSLDHVDDLKKTVDEIKRVTVANGLFLLLTEVHPRPTVNEPQVFGWDVVRRFEPEFTVLQAAHFEKHHMGLYQSLWEEMGCAITRFDETNPAPRYGVLSAKYVRR